MVDSMILPSITQIAVGVLVLVIGRKLSLFAGAAGFLIGYEVILRLTSSNVLAAVIAGVSAAVLAIVLVSIGKGVARLIAGIIGAIACAGIVASLFRSFGIDLGLFDWVLMVAGGLAGFVLMRRFFDWGILILACLIGASLVSHGLQDWLVLNATITAAIGIVLFVLGFIYQARAARK